MFITESRSSASGGREHNAVTTDHVSSSSIWRRMQFIRVVNYVRHVWCESFHYWKLFVVKWFSSLQQHGQDDDDQHHHTATRLNRCGIIWLLDVMSWLLRWWWKFLSSLSLFPRALSWQQMMDWRIGIKRVLILRARKFRLDKEKVYESWDCSSILWDKISLWAVFFFIFKVFSKEEN